MKNNIISTTFSRSETIKICGITTGKLNYLETQEIIKGLTPKLLGNRPAKRYTFTHLIEIKTIQKLRESLTVQQLRTAKQFLESIGETDTFHDKLLIVSDGKFRMVNRSDLGNYAVELAGKNQGQTSMLLLDFERIVSDLKHDGQKIKSFQDRIPSEYQNDLIAV